MFKPHQFDMEPQSFLNWCELFSTYLMIMVENWEKILGELRKMKDLMTTKEANDL